MAIYHSTVTETATLRLQLDPPPSGNAHAWLREYSAMSESDVGAASFPLLRPATAFTPIEVQRLATVAVASRDLMVSQEPACRVYTNFPAVIVATITNGIPIYARWVARSRNDSPVVGYGGGARLTALSDGAHTWTACLVWEEQ